MGYEEVWGCEEVNDEGRDVGSVAYEEVCGCEDENDEGWKGRCGVRG